MNGTMENHMSKTTTIEITIEEDGTTEVDIINFEGLSGKRLHRALHMAERKLRQLRAKKLHEQTKEAMQDSLDTDVEKEAQDAEESRLARVASGEEPPREGDIVLGDEDEVEDDTPDAADSAELDDAADTEKELPDAEGEAEATATADAPEGAQAKP